MGTIFHITARRDWSSANATGRYEPPSLETEGFIHCSTAAQTLATANRYYAGTSGLVLLCVDEEKTTAPVKYESPSDPGHDRADERFPHVHGPLNPDAVTRVVDFPANADGSFDAPQVLADVLGKAAAL